MAAGAGTVTDTGGGLAGALRALGRSGGWAGGATADDGWADGRAGRRTAGRADLGVVDVDAEVGGLGGLGLVLGVTLQLLHVLLHLPQVGLLI